MRDDDVFTAFFPYCSSWNMSSTSVVESVSVSSANSDSVQSLDVEEKNDSLNIGSWHL